MLKKFISGTNLRKLFKESLIVSFTEYFTLGTLFLTIILINRYFGNEVMADFNLCYGIAQIAVIGAGGAFSAIIRRDISLEAKPGIRFVYNVLELRLGLIIISLLIVVPFIFLDTASSQQTYYYLLLVLLAKGMDMLSETFYTTYQSLNEYRRYAFLKTLNASLFLTGIGLVSLLHMPVYCIYLSMLISSLLSVGINFLAYKSFYSNHPWASKALAEKKYKKYLLYQSWPLMLNAVFFQLSSRINIYIILILTDKNTVALFSGCLIGVTVFTAVSNSLGIVLFPGLNRQFNKSEPLLFLKKTTTALLLLFLIGCAAAVVFYFTIPLQLAVIGKLPQGAEQLFKYASLSIPFSFALAAVAYSFVIIKKQHYGLYVSVIALLFNIGIFYFYTTYFPQYGMMYAYILSCIFQVFIMYLILYGTIKKVHSKLI